MALDIIIRGGSVYDGTGSEPVTADIGIANGVISEVGQIADKAHQTIDANGAIVTPGFVDIHTHYDAQATWCDRLIPSNDHGVTTAIMGNCGVGFAPVRPADHDLLIDLMEGVEDIPEVVMKEGLNWQWESFEEFMDYLGARQYDMDPGAQLPHAAMRVYVMGERGLNREPANADDIAKMRKITESAMHAGAIGFSTSRWLHHKSASGEQTPSIHAEVNELVGIGLGMKDAGRGVFQAISEFGSLDDEFDILRQVAEKSDRPLSMSVGEGLSSVDWRDVMSSIEKANADGLEMRGQIAPRAIGVIMGLTASLSPFSPRESYREVLSLPFDERLRALSDPQRRAKILSETTDEFHQRLEKLIDGGNWIWEMGKTPDYEPGPEDSLAARAARAGMDAEEFMYDRMLANDGQTLFYSARANYDDGNFDVCREQILHPDTVMGLGDGGAHVGLICDASFTTTLLTHWGRDRSRGKGIDLPFLVKKQTSDTARAVGLTDRGIIKPGLKADINVIDFENLRVHTPKVVHDLPAGGARFQQGSSGYLATLVSGKMTYENGHATDALPGRLIRAH
ncbi:MAG: amidohydrolase family protein [Lysobacterales bacterium]